MVSPVCCCRFHAALLPDVLYCPMTSQSICTTCPMPSGSMRSTGLYILFEESGRIRDASADASDDEGMTALHCAALSGSVETVKLLLARGGDPAAGDIDGR